ncbi:MAG: hypothetical protein KC505_10350 [Myxococcales bacterium]|nr:hypothetical protein [Myxococcales bacterium]USN51664.1 MAG: hypothetical protein H6731_04445 [Myxococcales bacterium]
MKCVFSSLNISKNGAHSQNQDFLQHYPIEDYRPTMPQVYLYDLGRSLYDLKLDNILDWQMQNPSEYGYWTLGFNGAMTVIAPEFLGLDLDYAGQGVEEFRRDRINDLNTYLNNSQWNFDNTWSYFILPWTKNTGNRQSINDLMSGLLIYLSDEYGGVSFLARLFQNLKQQPTTPSKTDRQARAQNLYEAAKKSVSSSNLGNLENFFKQKMRWSFLN